MYIYVCVYIRICTHVHRHMYNGGKKVAFIGDGTNGTLRGLKQCTLFTWMYVYIYVNMYIYIFTHMHIYEYVHMNRDIYVCIYINVQFKNSHMQLKNYANVNTFE
jgi:hypothetical protein